MAVFGARLSSTLLIPIVFISSYFLFMATLIFLHAAYYNPAMAAILFDTGQFPVSYQLSSWALYYFRLGAPACLDLARACLDSVCDIFSFLHPFFLRSAAWVFYFLR